MHLFTYLFKSSEAPEDMLTVKSPRGHTGLAPTEQKLRRSHCRPSWTAVFMSGAFKRLGKRSDRNSYIVQSNSKP